MKLIWTLMAATVAASGVTSAPHASAQTTTRTPAQIACAMGGACIPATATATAPAEDGDGDADGPLLPVATGTRPICMFNACKSAAPKVTAPAVALVRRPATRPAIALGRRSRLTAVPAPVAVAGAGRRHADMQLPFASGSADLTDAVKGEVRKFAQTLTDPTLGMADARVTIEGHTSSVGSAAANQDLSQRRAQAVVDYMTALGVAPDRLKAVGYGPSRPLPGHDGADAANRRVEIAKD